VTQLSEIFSPIYSTSTISTKPELVLM